MTTIACEEDRTLVARMLAGDQRAHDEFFMAYAQRLTAFLARRSRLSPDRIEEVVQKTLIKATRNIRSYRGEAALHTWLCAICRRELINALQRAARQPEHESLDEGPCQAAVLAMPAPAEHEPVNALERVADRVAIATTLRSLPERYARALEWKYKDGISVREIAERLSLTPLATQSLLARAREAFKAGWQQQTPGPVAGDVRSYPAHAGVRRRKAA